MDLASEKSKEGVKRKLLTTDNKGSEKPNWWLFSFLNHFSSSSVYFVHFYWNETPHETLSVFPASTTLFSTFSKQINISFSSSLTVISLQVTHQLLIDSICVSDEFSCYRNDSFSQTDNWLWWSKMTEGTFYSPLKRRVWSKNEGVNDWLTLIDQRTDHIRENNLKSLSWQLEDHHLHVVLTDYDRLEYLLRRLKSCCLPSEVESCCQPNFTDHQTDSDDEMLPFLLMQSDKQL